MGADGARGGRYGRSPDQPPGRRDGATGVRALHRLEVAREPRVRTRCSTTFLRGSRGETGRGCDESRCVDVAETPERGHDLIWGGA